MDCIVIIFFFEFVVVLFKDGYFVEFEEIDDWNVVEIWVNG